MGPTSMQAAALRTRQTRRPRLISEFGHGFRHFNLQLVLSDATARYMHTPPRTTKQHPDTWAAAAVLTARLCTVPGVEAWSRCHRPAGRCRCRRFCWVSSAIPIIEVPGWSCSDQVSSTPGTPSAGPPSEIERHRSTALNIISGSSLPASISDNQPINLVPARKRNKVTLSEERTSVNVDPHPHQRISNAHMHIHP